MKNSLDIESVMDTFDRKKNHYSSIYIVDIVTTTSVFHVSSISFFVYVPLYLIFFFSLTSSIVTLSISIKILR